MAHTSCRVLRLATLAALAVPSLAHAGLEFGQVHPLSAPGDPYSASALVHGSSPGIQITNAPFSAYSNLGLPSGWSQRFRVRYAAKTHRVMISSDQPLAKSVVVILDVHRSPSGHALVECPLPGQPAPKVSAQKTSSQQLDTSYHRERHVLSAGHLEMSPKSNSAKAAARLRQVLSAGVRDNKVHPATESRKTITNQPASKPVASTPSTAQSWKDSPFFHVGKGHVVAVMVGTGKDRHWDRVNQAPTSSSSVRDASLPSLHWRSVPLMPVVRPTEPAFVRPILSASSVHTTATRPFLHGYGVPCLAGGWAFVGHVHVQPGQSLYRIAGRVNATNRFSRTQVMVAIFRLNQSAFLEGNPNLLRAGSVLTMPTFQQVRAMTPSHALVWMRLNRWTRR